MRLSIKKYKQLLTSIGLTIEQARERAAKAINTELVKANWEIGRHIVEYEQQGQERAEYGVSYWQGFLKIYNNDMEKDLADGIY